MNIDKTTVENAASGDMTAFRQIFTAYGDFVYSTALRVVGNSHDAEEVVQNVFISIHKKIKKFNFEASLKTWIYRITTNQAINYAKKSTALKTKKIHYINNTENTLADNSAVYTQLDSQTKADGIDRMLDILTPEQKACLLLRSKEELSYKEISDILEISIDSVRSRIKRAREKLMSKRKDFTDAM